MCRYPRGMPPILAQSRRSGTHRTEGLRGTVQISVIRHYSVSVSRYRRVAGYAPEHCQCRAESTILPPLNTPFLLWV
jgi:hypothetical protein